MILVLKPTDSQIQNVIHLLFFNQNEVKINLHLDSSYGSLSNISPIPVPDHSTHVTIYFMRGGKRRT